jgi:hypothetical protein
MEPALTTAEDQRWKSYNWYEKRNLKYTQKQMISDEIANITMKLVKQRDENSEPDTAPPADVEMLNRVFGERNRFYNTYYPNKFGIKQVVGPFGASTLHELKQEEKYLKAMEKS